MKVTKNAGRSNAANVSTDGFLLTGIAVGESRKRHRIPIELPARITACDHRGVRRFEMATCTDFSDGGVAFESDAEFAVGEVVFFEFLMAGEVQPHDRALVEVIHRDENGYGAAFVKPRVC